MASYEVFDDEFKVRRLFELIDLLVGNLHADSRAEVLGKSFRSHGYAKLVQDIGYVSKNLSDSLKQQLPEGLVEELSILHEDILIRYYELDHSLVWEAASHKVPLLKNSLASKFPELA